MQRTFTKAKASRAIRSKASKKRAKLLSTYFQTQPGGYGEGDVFLGLTVPQLRALVKEFRTLPLAETEQLLRSRFHEERVFAVMLWSEQFAKGSPIERRAIYQAYLRNRRYVNNWDLVDGSAPYIVGSFLHERSRAPLYRLARSKSLWDRRIAVVATWHFIRNQDFTDIQKLAELLMEDPHHLMHKAIGWMLREMGKRDEAELHKFLRKHAARMPRTALRYSLERLSPQHRAFYMSRKRESRARC